jgi:hypothetical protein
MHGEGISSVRRVQNHLLRLAKIMVLSTVVSSGGNDAV